MKYCHACGQEIDDDTLFCPFCGTRQESLTDDEPEIEPEAQEEPAFEPDADLDDDFDAEPQEYQDVDFEEENIWRTPEEEEKAPEKPAKKKKKSARRKKKLALTLGIVGGAVILAAAVVLLLLTGAIGALLPHSKAKLQLAEVNLLKEAAGYTNTGLNAAENVNASYVLTGKMSTSKDSYYAVPQKYVDLIGKIKLSGGIIGDSKNVKFSSSLEIKENEVLNALLMMDQKELGVYTSLIDDAYYTCKLEDLSEILTNNGEAPDTDKLKDTDLARKDLEKALTVAFKDLFDSKLKITKGKTVQLFDEEETVKGAVIYQISPTEKEWKKLLQDLYDNLFYKGSYANASLEYYVEMSGVSKDPSDFLDQIKDQIPDLAEKLADLDVKIEVVMKGNTIIRQSVYLKDEQYQMGYDALSSGKTSRFFAFYAENDKVTPVFDFQRTVNGRNAEFEGTVYSGRNNKLARISGSGINLKKRSTLNIPVGEYSVTINEGYTYRVDLNVAPEGKGMNHELRFKMDQNMRYRSFDSLSLTLYTEKGAKVSKPKGLETEEITDRKDLEKLAEKLAQKAEKALGKYFN